MNRTDRLLEGVENWKGRGEIVVVDWSSETPVKPIPGVKLIRVDGQQYFNLAKAFNLAAFQSSGNILCKMDVDYRAESKFWGFMVFLTPQEFFAGDFKNYGDPQDQFLCGSLCLPRIHFEAINGYDERMDRYGWDDEDIKIRLRRIGLKKIDIHPRMGISHKPHDDVLRFSNHQIKGMDYGPNKKISESNPWGLNHERTSYELIQLEDNYFKAVMGCRIVKG